MSRRGLYGPDGLPLDPVDRARHELSRKIDRATYGRPVMVLGPDGKEVWSKESPTAGLEAWLPSNPDDSRTFGGGK